MQQTRAGAERAAARRLCRRMLLLALAVGLGVTAAATGIVLTIPDRTAAPGANLTLPVTVAGALDLGGVDLVVGYDPAVLRFVSAAPGSLADRPRIQANESVPGTVLVSVTSPRPVTGDGPLVALTFAAIGSAGARSTVALEARNAVTVDGDPVQVETTGGTVSVGGGGRVPLSLAVVFGGLGVASVAAAHGRVKKKKGGVS